MALSPAGLRLTSKPTKPTDRGAKRALALRMPAGRSRAESLRGATEARAERR
jgi:hypothetical protein